MPKGKGTYAKKTPMRGSKAGYAGGGKVNRAT